MSVYGDGERVKIALPMELFTMVIVAASSMANPYPGWKRRVIELPVIGKDSERKETGRIRQGT